MRLMIVVAVLTVLAFLCLYAAWPSLRSRKGSAVFWGVALAVFGAWLSARWLDARLAQPAGFFVSAWVGASLASVGLGLGVVVLRGAGRLARRLRQLTVLAPADAPAVNVDLGRRRFLGSTMALPGVAVSVGAGGAIGGAHEFEVKHVEIAVPGLPRALDGFRVGQITDVHVGDFIQPEFLARAVDAMNAERVDLQVMTGDLIDDLSQLEPTMVALERCRAPLGMLAVLGNHEKFRDEQQVLDAYARVRERGGPVRLLVDESVIVEHRGQPLRVVGVDYPMGRRGERRGVRREQRRVLMRESADKAFREVRAGEPVLCLTHHPDFFPFAAERGAAVTLAGHTHGGQVAFLGRSLLQTYEFMFGRYERGGAQLYVSGGTGHWLPFRVGVPTEVTILTLRRAA